jgi:hypothetical protein
VWAVFSTAGPALHRPWPISTREPACQPVTAPPSLTNGAHLSGRLPPNPPRSRARWHCRRNSHRCVIHPSPPLDHEDAHMCSCHLEPSHQLRCTVASHHRCPPASALITAASVGLQSRPLGDEVLEQAAPLAKLPLSNVCRGGHRLALPTRMRSRVDWVRWHSPSCRMASLGSDAPSTSPPPAAKGQRHARVASTQGYRSSRSLHHLRPRVHVLLTWRDRALAARAEPSHPSHPLSAHATIKGIFPVHFVHATGFVVRR